MSSVLGLTSYRWENNYKSALLLGGFPLMLLTLLGGVFYIYGYVLSHGQDFVPAAAFIQFGLNTRDITTLNIPQTPFDFAYAAMMTYWPYVLGVATLWVVLGYLFNDALIHAATGAHAVARNDNPRLYNLLENLCISRGMTMPGLYIIDTPVMNAYASGLNEKSFSITVTQGLLDQLNDREVEAVLGHELTHIINRDCRLLVITVVFAGMLSFAAQMLWRTMQISSFSRNDREDRGSGQATMVLMIIAGMAMFVGYLMAVVLRLALSRRREFMADAGSVELTKNPEALISALRKISGNCDVPHVPSEARQMFIENPPSIFDMGGLFATHPPIDVRIHVLEQIAGTPLETAAPHGSSMIPPSL